MKKLLLIITFFYNLFSHPHTFIDVYPTISQKSIHIQWVFDEMTSNMIMMDFDTNHNMLLEKKESELIHNEAFIHLGEFSFYMFFKKGSQEIKVSKATNFSVIFKDNRVIYSFILERVSGVKKIEFYDPELYMAFVLKKESIKSLEKFELYEINNDYYFGYGIAIK